MFRHSTTYRATYESLLRRAHKRSASGSGLENLENTDLAKVALPAPCVSFYLRTQDCRAQALYSTTSLAKARSKLADHWTPENSVVAILAASIWSMTTSLAILLAAIDLGPQNGSCLDPAVC